MIALLQRVSHASVIVEGKIVGEIGRGLAVLVGIREDDTGENAEQLSSKVTHLRVFPDRDGKMNLSAVEIHGQLLVVSQFTLYGDTSKGNRPSYSHAARPEIARPLYDLFVENCRRTGLVIQPGIFGAEMLVNLENDGPVTLICQSENK